LTLTEWILFVLAIIISLVIAVAFTKYAAEKLRLPNAVKGIVGVITFLGIGMIVSSLLVAPIGEVTGLRVPPPPPPPVEPIPERVGYALAIVTDQYKLPETAIENAEVQATILRPEPGAPIVEVVSGKTDADGTVFLKLPGITSGTVYLVASKSGYYSAVGETVIPGAEVYPDPALWERIQLAKIGELSLSVTDLSTGASWDAATKTITENLTTSKVHWFTIELTVKAAYEALRDMQLLFIQGGDWENLGATPMVVTTVDAAGTRIEEVGDLTLATQISAKLNAHGDLTHARVLRIKIQTGTTYAFGNKELLRIVIDDLLGGVGFVGETGIGSVEIKVKTVV